MKVMNKNEKYRHAHAHTINANRNGTYAEIVGLTSVITHWVSFGAHFPLLLQLAPGSLGVAVAAESNIRPSVRRFGGNRDQKNRKVPEKLEL